MQGGGIILSAKIEPTRVVIEMFSFSEGEIRFIRFIQYHSVQYFTVLHLYCTVYYYTVHYITIQYKTVRSESIISVHFKLNQMARSLTEWTSVFRKRVMCQSNQRHLDGRTDFFASACCKGPILHKLHKYRSINKAWTTCF